MYYYEIATMLKDDIRTGRTKAATLRAAVINLVDELRDPGCTNQIDPADLLEKLATDLGYKVPK